MNNANYAVRFNESVDRGMGENKLFPFSYSMVRKSLDVFALTPAPGTSLGVSVAPGRTVEMPILLDADFNFLLQYIKFSVHRYDAGSDDYQWHGGAAALPNGSYGDPMLGAVLGLPGEVSNPLLRSLAVAIDVKGPDGRILVGGKRLNASQQNVTLANWNDSLDERSPIDASTRQGGEYGGGAAYLPFLLPREGMVILRMSNQEPAGGHTIIVSALIHGYKVRL